MTVSHERPTCWIIAGPNGAGKTTFAMEYLPNAVGCRRFVNADMIAAGMAPLAPESERISAGRLFLREIERYIRARRSFGFETTLAGRTYLRWIQRMRSAGWRIELIYLVLPSAEMARQRVAERVAHGGHDIPQEDIERRFLRGLTNLFSHYGAAVDRVICLSNESEQPGLVFTCQGGNLKVFHPEQFNTIQKLASDGDERGQ